MQGTVKDASGAPYLNWIEQGIAQECVPDTTPPLGAITIDGGAAYTNNVAVSLDLHAEDISGILAYEVTDAVGPWLGVIDPAATNYSDAVPGILSPGDGIKTVSACYVDIANNWSAACTDTIILDQTPPTAIATATKSDGTPYVAGTWTNQDVTVHFSGTDSSGLDSVTGDATVSTEGVTPLVSGTVTDNAGNSTSASFGPIKIDKTAPAITGSRTPEANDAGWNNTDVTVSFTASDDLSGVASVTPDTVVSTEGAGQAVTGTATDNAGNSAGVMVSDINIDKTPPVVEITVPGTGQYQLGETGLEATWSATDTLSGVAPPSSGTIPIDTSVVGTESTIVALAGTAVDYAGNASLEVTAEYSYYVTYVFLGLLSPYQAPPRTFHIGSAIPLKWQYGDILGNVVDSSAALPSISVNPVGSPGGTGSRDLQYDYGNNTWSFNWQTEGIAAGVYHIEIYSDQTGQMDGPFYIQLD
jgi:hypothetical protein